MAKQATVVAPVAAQVEEQDDFVMEETTIDKIPAVTRQSDNADRIVKWASSMLPLAAKRINPEKMKYGTLTAIVRRLKKANKLGADFGTERRSDGFYFVRNA